MPASPIPQPSHSHRRSNTFSDRDRDARDANCMPLDANPIPISDPDTDDATWMSHLRPIPGGTLPIPDLANIRLTLTHCPLWANLLAFDLAHYEIMALRPPPFALPSSTSNPSHDHGPALKWTDHHDTLLLDWLQRHSIHVQSLATVSQAVRSIAHSQPYHPIRDYFNSLTWDGTPRLDTWLSDYLGAYPSLYSRAVGRLFLVAAVTRTFNPGTKYDYCLILEGPQGTRKSTALRVLADPWFAESNYSLGSMNSVLSLRGILIMELPELSALEKVEVSTIKQALSCQVDRVRPPYGRHVIDIPRESVFAGTSNHDTYLHDETGNRRFLPVRTGEISLIDTDALTLDRDQLWAEAVQLYRSRKIKCYLEGQVLALQVEREQRARYQSDPWESGIETWLRDGHYTAVTIEQVLTSCVQLPLKEQKKGAQMQAARCLRALGWERYKSTGGGRKWIWRLKAGGGAGTGGVSTGKPAIHEAGAGTGAGIGSSRLSPGLGKRVGIGPEEQDYESNPDED